MSRIKLTVATLLLIFIACDDTNSNGPVADINNITENTTWDGDQLIDGKVYIQPGVTLTITAGSVIKFKKNNAVEDKGAIIALPGADGKASGRLVAIGTSSNPVIFTSAELQGSRARQDWGGIILAGRGFTNRSGGVGSVEGVPESAGVTYGGTNDADDSGILRYVRIEYCGATLSEGNEINGLSLYGVGTGTTLEYIQVYKNSDDGFEWFGGSVNGKYLVSTFNEDDAFDMDEGWNGYGQFWLAVQQISAAGPDNGFESDGRKDIEANSGRSTSPMLRNVTLVGPNGVPGDGSNRGLRLREDFEGDLRNFVIANFYHDNMKLDKESDATGDDTFNNFGTVDSTGKALTIDNVLFVNNNVEQSGSFMGFREDSAGADQARYLTSNITYSAGPVFTAAGIQDYSLTVTPVAEPVAANSFFSATNYVGAFDGTTNWLTGWTRWNDNDMGY